MFNKKSLVRFTAKIVLFSMTMQLIMPIYTYALTTGPSQPEVQGFEPVGTTDMVDLFTGDFVYNIPLLDIEGYPINISYHSGGDIEQEASWVGLGWNINPGVINRSVRGMPDDFSGESITKTLKIKPEKNVRVGIGLGAEIGGLGDPYLDLGLTAQASINKSNYRGVSMDLGIGLNAGVNVIPRASAGINIGVGSQSGADIDYNLGLNFSTSHIINSDLSASLGFNYGSGYNTRAGLKARTFSIGTGALYGKSRFSGPGASVSVPIGVQNYIPVITNASKMSTLRGQIKLGGEIFGGFPNMSVNAMVSQLNYQSNGTRNGYGYLYAQSAGENDIQDFTRDKDGMFNETMKFASPGNMTYDIYNVSGQGTGGSFRPFRNDFGTVYDPVVSDSSKSKSMEFEAGLGGYVELGYNKSLSHTVATSGPWKNYMKKFTGRKSGSIYENYYFKKAGELTEVDPGYFSAIGGFKAVSGTSSKSLPESKNKNSREPRASLINFFTANEASKFGVASSRNIESYTSTNGFSSGPNAVKHTINRVGGNRKNNQMSEIIQTQTDGSKYIYSIPAMNNIQTEMTFAVEGTPTADGLITYASGDNTSSNAKGRDNFFSSTTTPSFAHSYLLTSVVSADYVDIKGDGITDDDFGTFTKFNYTLKNEAYGWKTPYGTNTAQHNPGFKSDKKDDKASYISGTREQWILHSVESKNYVAEFYTSVRNDGKGVNISQDHSYKLDSIKLFNKHERFINTTNAVPVKTVIFKYDYSLCKGIPNTSGVIGTDGKLTLKNIYIRYGNSYRSMISPYQFEYGYNPNYNAASKDRWGVYKPNSVGELSNTEYPYTNQSDPNLNNYAAAWSLEQIKLPSGGTIKVSYEMDDYAYVQDKIAMEMFKIKGVGASKIYNPGSSLYIDKKTPNLYYYFQRRKSDEKPDLSLRDNYLKDQNILFYNFDTYVTEGKSSEPIKGYAEIEEVGYCNDDLNSEYAYIKVKPITPQGTGDKINPSTYMAINFSRYYLSHIIYPGADDDLSDITNVLAGLKSSFNELLNVLSNPISYLVNEGKSKRINISNSYMRLNSPGLKKRGGGARVQKLEFFDNWNQLAGANTNSATYGKYYDYTTTDLSGMGIISSGVASYEPQIGGDENPFRMPSEYTGRSGGKFPPHDPIGLYQEMPIGETLYPSPIVGYSKVTVTSIHKEVGRSSQGVDINEFYTAKDFPIQIDHTPLEVLEKENKYSLFDQRSTFKIAQGYSIVLNDMHGKPKRTEHRVVKTNSGLSELVNYQEYNYFTEGYKLNNNIPVLEYDPTEKRMKKVYKQIGVEADVTIDSRDKTEDTRSATEYVNLNIFPTPIIPYFPLLYFYELGNNYHNNFSSIVTTKVIQQYGIIKEVQSFKEGALTVVRNEAFDPLTGQALITSVNNEFNDIEYSVNYPAYWGYKNMGPSYSNIGYFETFGSLPINNHTAIIPESSAGKYSVGDELFITYIQDGVQKENNVWVTGKYIEPSSGVGGGIQPRPCSCNELEWHKDFPSDTVYVNTDTLHLYSTSCTDEMPYNIGNNCLKIQYFLQPRYKHSFPLNGIITNVNVTIVRSGNKNMLNESIQNYTTMDNPLDSKGLLKDNLTKLITLSAKTYSDTLTAILPKYDGDKNLTFWDSLNVYLNGTKQINRLHKEYAYIKNRDYLTTTSRDKGLFNAKSFWTTNKYSNTLCDVDTYFCYIPNNIVGYNKVYKYIASTSSAHEMNEHYFYKPNPTNDHNWVVGRTVTKYSPWGQELENKDAIGNYSSAIFGYNQLMPIAVMQNAKQHEAFAESFEDYLQLSVLNTLVDYRFNPFASMFSKSVYSSSIYEKFNLTSGTFSISNVAAHSGQYSLATGSVANINLKLNNNPLFSYSSQVKYIPFTLQTNRKYIVSYWFRPKSPAANPSEYVVPSSVKVKSNIIDGWQQAEGIISTPSSGSTMVLNLPTNAYVDDIRIFPVDANIKSFVYHHSNLKLIASLDENNFASFYEYDQEGNLIRTKKETEKGIATISESRSANAKK